MERTVAEIASKLLSDDLMTVTNASALLRQQHERLKSQGPTSSRLIQELAIYQQGVVVKKLLKQVLDSGSLVQKLTQLADNPGWFFAPFDSETKGLGQISFFTLIFLASHRGAARFILKEEGTAEKLVGFLLENLPNGAAYRQQSINGMHPWTIPSLQGLANFSRASKNFRQAVKERDDLLPALQYLLEDAVVKQVTKKDVFSEVRKDLADLVLALTFAEDSQVWMVEKGYLKLLADVCRTEPQDENGAESDGSTICSLTLLRLCDSSAACFKKMREVDALSILRDYSKTLEGIIPIPGLWENIFVPKMTGIKDGSRFSKLSEDSKGEIWSMTGACLSYVATVCSWEGCREKPELKMGTKFSKCGRCAVAHYCRYVL